MWLLHSFSKEGPVLLSTDGTFPTVNIFLKHVDGTFSSYRVSYSRNLCHWVGTHLIRNTGDWKQTQVTELEHGLLAENGYSQPENQLSWTKTKWVLCGFTNGRLHQWQPTLWILHNIYVAWISKPGRNLLAPPDSLSDRHHVLNRKLWYDDISDMFNSEDTGCITCLCAHVCVCVWSRQWKCHQNSELFSSYSTNTNYHLVLK